MDMDVDKRAAAAIPKLRELLKDQIKDLKISDDDLNLLLSFSYRTGLQDQADAFMKLLNDQGIFTIKKS